MNPTLIRTSAVDPRHRPEAIAERLAPAERRRGRGAATNVSGRFELRAARGFRRRLDARGGARAAGDRGDLGEAKGHHRPQRVARHPVRPVDQPLPRLRARLLLLLRAADPRLYGALRRARFRDAPVRQAGRGRAARAGARRRPSIGRRPSRSAPTPIPISRSSGNIASPARSSRFCSAPGIR